jgi:hypothetical protein
MGAYRDPSSAKTGSRRSGVGPFLSWIGSLIGTALAGPGAAVIGDPGVDGALGEARAPIYAYRLAGVTLMLAVLLVAGAPWQLLLLIAAAAAVWIWILERRRRPTN